MLCLHLPQLMVGVEFGILGLFMEWIGPRLLQFLELIHSLWNYCKARQSLEQQIQQIPEHIGMRHPTELKILIGL